MSEIRNLLRLSKRLVVPEGYEHGVGTKVRVNEKVVDGNTGQFEVEELPTDVDGQKLERGANPAFVANAATRHVARFNKAYDNYLSTKQALLKGNKKMKPQPEEVAEHNALKELDEMAELVRRFAVEAGPDGSGAVTADMAAALGSLDRPVLEMVMRRAGNPPLFQPLLGGELADIPAGADPNNIFVPADTPMLREGDKAIGAMKVAREQKKLDKKASVKSLPMIQRSSSHFGKPGNSKAYSDVEPKDHDPMALDTARLIQDPNTGEWRAFDPVADAPRRAASKSASGLEERTLNELLDSMAGDQIGQAEAMKQGGGRLTIGVGQSGDAPWNRKIGRRDSGKPIDRVVEKRNRGLFRKVAETIERAGFDASGVATEGTFNLDMIFPRWRARVAEMDEGGKLAYPSQLPSAEYVTGMIIGMHKFTEPGLFERWLPIVRRSIDAAPDEPSTKEARRWSQQVFVPSKSFRKAMEGGVGSKDYPYRIYGPRKVDLPEVGEPQAPQPQQPASRDDTAAKLERLKKAQKKPGTNDQSSIYMMPSNSPMSGLLA